MSFFHTWELLIYLAIQCNRFMTTLNSICLTHVRLPIGDLLSTKVHLDHSSFMTSVEALFDLNFAGHLLKNIPASWKKEIHLQCTFSPIETLRSSFPIIAHINVLQYSWNVFDIQYDIRYRGLTVDSNKINFYTRLIHRL